ncbi:hypothetical protein TKK_0006706 [Trichogramma kaykai]|uniref:Hairy n=1 Tax=Trichogramma kaykai TaxID=54128 RepID=A0ABD2XD25_9HYME
MVTGVQTMPAGAVTVSVASPSQHVPQEAVQPASPPQTTSPTPRRSSENRRSNKPIMEKRRRARINNCLNELKSLILDAMKKDPARHSKLEKADILEMTVKHLESLQRQQSALTQVADPTVVNKFRAGYNECVSEIGRFPGLDSAAKRRLMAHLSNVVVSSDANGNQTVPTQQSIQTAGAHLQVHILPSSQGDNPAQVQVQAQPANSILYMTPNGASLQLVPTRLSNGSIALVAGSPKSSPIAPPSTIPTPASSPAPSSPLPTLIPIPDRTASTASASSSVSSNMSTSTSAASPVAFDSQSSSSYHCEESRSPAPSHDASTSPSSAGYHSDPEYDQRIFSPPLQKPLSLVMRKSVIKEAMEEKCWRPW